MMKGQLRWLRSSKLFLGKFVDNLMNEGNGDVSLLLGLLIDYWRRSGLVMCCCIWMGCCIICPEAQGMEK